MALVVSGGGGGDTVALGTRGVSSGGGGEAVELTSEGVSAGDGDDMGGEVFRRGGESEGFDYRKKKGGMKGKEGLGLRSLHREFDFFRDKEERGVCCGP